MPYDLLILFLHETGKRYNSAVECHLDIVKVVGSSLIIPKTIVHFFSILAHTPTDGDDKTVSNDENANTVPILRFGSSTGKKVGTQTLDSPTANANHPSTNARNRPSPPPPRVVAPACTAPPRRLPCPHSRCAGDSRDFAIGDVFAAAAAGLANSSMSTTASREIW